MPTTSRVGALFASMALAACGGSATTPAVSPSPGVATAQSHTLTVDGKTRTYYLFRPHELNETQRVPLVIAIHGYTQPAVKLEALTRFDEQATQGGFVVVYPDGIDHSWNAGSCCGNAQASKVDDVSFVKKLIDSLVSSGGTDPKRVFITGLSNGGMMAHRLACELSDRIAAIASVAGALITHGCSPARPISVLEMHALNDSIVPYDGGSTADDWQLPATISFMARWARLDGCAATPAVVQSGTTRTSAWSDCREGAVVVLDAISGSGGHVWFGSANGLAGEPNATQVIWDFFSHAPPRS